MMIDPVPVTRKPCAGPQADQQRRSAGIWSTTALPPVLHVRQWQWGRELLNSTAPKQEGNEAGHAGGDLGATLPLQDGAKLGGRRMSTLRTRQHCTAPGIGSWKNNQHQAKGMNARVSPLIRNVGPVESQKAKPKRPRNRPTAVPGTAGAAVACRRPRPAVGPGRHLPTVLPGADPHQGQGDSCIAEMMLPNISEGKVAPGHQDQVA
jgi:hypothetical protein